MSELPATLAWLPSFTESLNRALLGDLQGWRVMDEADPLKKVLCLQFTRSVRKYEPPLIREILREWARINDCVYRHSAYERNEFRALIVLKGLRPVRNKNPFLEH